jgi:transcriptional regulator with GAF, ATPase, and Fis domain
MRPNRQHVSGRVILTREVVHIEDVLDDPEYPQHLARAGGWRAILGVPMLRDRNAIGMIGVVRGQPGPFSDRQIDLLKTFADQAVIAIENARLFDEVQSRTRELTERTRELTETLEYQTATSEILNVISRSPSQLKPVDPQQCVRPPNRDRLVFESRPQCACPIVPSRDALRYEGLRPPGGGSTCRHRRIVRLPYSRWCRARPEGRMPSG